MCNTREQHVKWVEYCKVMQDLELSIPTRQSARDLPESDDVRINAMALVMRAAGNNIELVSRKFCFPALGPRVDRSSIFTRSARLAVSMVPLNHPASHFPPRGFSFRNKKSLATASSPIFAASNALWTRRPLWSSSCPIAHCQRSAGSWIRNFRTPDGIPVLQKPTIGLGANATWLALSQRLRESDQFAQ